MPDRDAVGDGVLLRCPLRPLGHEAQCKLPVVVFLASAVPGVAVGDDMDKTYVIMDSRSEVMHTDRTLAIIPLTIINFSGTAHRIFADAAKEAGPHDQQQLADHPSIEHHSTTSMESNRNHLSFKT